MIVKQLEPEDADAASILDTDLTTNVIFHEFLRLKADFMGIVTQHQQT